MSSPFNNPLILAYCEKVGIYEIYSHNGNTITYYSTLEERDSIESLETVRPDMRCESIFVTKRLQNSLKQRKVGICTTILSAKKGETA